MATGVHSWSTTAASNSTADSAINWAEGQAPSTVNDSARGMMAKVAEMRKDQAGTLTTAGTSTAYTIAAPNATYASLTELDGVKLAVRFNATNGAAPTLNVASLGAKAIQTASGTAVATGAILANSVHELTYDNSIPAFLLHGAFDVQPKDAELTAIAGLTSAADKVPYFTGSGTAAVADFTAAGRAVAGGASAAAQRSSLGVVIGTDVASQTDTRFTVWTLQRLTSGTAATYTTPAVVRRILVRMIGGGGGGGGATSGGTAGGAGGTTSFESWGGGGGGGGATVTGEPGAGGSGGATGTGTLIRRVTGARGGQIAQPYGGGGGSSQFALMAPTGRNAQAGDAGPANTGAGGGGGSSGVNSGSGGGAGEYVEFFINTPSATYTYTIGAGGTAGAAGGAPGGAGGSGVIEVYEFY